MGAWFDRLMGGDDIFWAWMNELPHMTPARMARLIRRFGAPRDIFDRAKQDGLPAVEGIPDELKAALCDRATDDTVAKLAARFERLGIYPLSMENDSYPAPLLQIHTPPLLLYCRGNGRLKTLDKAIAVVGSRKASEYALHTAGRIARDLAGQGVTIVSGMALGVDAAAHWGALESGGSQSLLTIAVLAGGVDCIYPACHGELYRRIRENGLILSENPLGTHPAAYSFPLRNRIIAGLASGTLVAEAAEKSGTRHTVNYALENGRDVFALPGRADDPSCRGSNSLLRQGARLVTSAAEILEEYPWWQSDLKTEKSVSRTDLSAEEKRICALLKTRDQTADELIEQLDFSTGQLLSLLTKLAEKEIIERKSNSHYHYIY